MFQLENGCICIECSSNLERYQLFKERVTASRDLLKPKLEKLIEPVTAKKIQNTLRIVDVSSILIKTPKIIEESSATKDLNNKKQTPTGEINAVKSNPSQTIEFPRTIKIVQAAPKSISNSRNASKLLKLPDAIRMTPIRVASKKPVIKPSIDSLKEVVESSTKCVQATNLQLIPTPSLNLQNDPLKIEIKVEDGNHETSKCHHQMPSQETPSVLEKIVDKPLTTIEIESDEEKPEIKQQNELTKAPKMSKLLQEIIKLKQIKMIEKVRNNLLETLRAKREVKSRKFGQESRAKKLRERFLKPILKPTEKNLFCDKCEFHCNDKEILVRHITVWHIPDPEVETILCKFCESTFTTKDKLIFHQNNKHPDMNKFTCAICYSNYSSLELLREHRRTQKCVRIKPRHPRTARTKVVCPKCGGLYLQSQITRHIAKIHDRERNFKCTVSFNFLLSEEAFNIIIS
jgi:hypothetical protein